MLHWFDDASCSPEVVKPRVHEDPVDGVHQQANLHRLTVDHPGRADHFAHLPLIRDAYRDQGKGASGLGTPTSCRTLGSVLPSVRSSTITPSSPRLWRTSKTKRAN